VISRYWAAVALIATLGCARVVTAVTSEPPPWSYVEDGWGGVRLGAPEIVSGVASLPFTFHAHDVKRMDSGTCLHGASTRLDGPRIVLRLDKCVCGPGTLSDMRVALPVLTKGTYAVVYDDATAGFPLLGEIRVP
jgi:hypothetical protein